MEVELSGGEASCQPKRIPGVSEYLGDVQEQQYAQENKVGSFYIWIYMYPELAVQNPVIQQNFKHILQFEEILIWKKIYCLANKINSGLYHKAAKT